MGMTLYELDTRLASFEPEIDPETGEILNAEEFEQISLERRDKLEGLALKAKNLDALAKALKDEKKAIDERLKSAESRRDSVKRFLTDIMRGEKLETARCKIGWRKSTSVDIFDPDTFRAWAEEQHPELLRVTVKTEPDKTAIGEALKAGEVITGARMAENLSIQIK